MTALALLASVVGLAWCPAERHVEAAGLLLRFENPHEEPEGLARLGYHPVEVASLTLGAEQRPIAARSYTPRGVSDPPGVLLVHGVHAQGIGEPRLREFAQVMASAGVEVVTPQIGPLTRYDITPEATQRIGEASAAYADRLEQPDVGVIGISFSGGLALLAATHEDYAERIGFVLAVGAHHDLARVLRWYASEPVEGPAGRPPASEPHPYGAGVFIYAQAEAFFEPRDLETAKEALRLLLQGQRERARQLRSDLSPSGRRQLTRILQHETEGPLKERFLERVEALRPGLARVSPHGKLGALRASVFLVHGVDDPVVPATETRWLARSVPDEHLESVVITPFLRHAERRGPPSWMERLELVHLMAEVLAAVHRGAT